MEQETQQQLNTLKKQVEDLTTLVDENSKTSAFLDMRLDDNSKKVINEAVSTEVHNTLWNEIFYTSTFATASITTTTTELLDANGRESDTSAGKRFKPERECRFKMAFYLNADIASSTIYITSPAVSLSSSIGTSMIDTNKGYVGVKIIAGAISLVYSAIGSTAETLISTSETISDNTTHILEIDYYVSHAVVLFNNEIIGDISCNLRAYTFETFFPFLTSVGSDDASSVNLTIESYEFLQKR